MGNRFAEYVSIVNDEDLDEFSDEGSSAVAEPVAAPASRSNRFAKFAAIVPEELDVADLEALNAEETEAAGQPLAKPKSIGLGKAAAGGAGLFGLGIAKEIPYIPETLSRMGKGSAELVSGSPSLPARALGTLAGIGGKLFEPIADAIAPTGERFSQYIDRQIEESPALSNVAAKGQYGDQAVKAAINGDFRGLKDVVSDPEILTAYAAQAVPTIALLVANPVKAANVPIMALLEGLEGVGSAREYERRTGKKISDDEFAAAITFKTTLGTLFERFGFGGVTGKSLTGALIKEPTTEALQNTTGNVAQALYDPSKRTLEGQSEGMIQSVIGGVAGGGIGHGLHKGIEALQPTAEPQPTPKPQPRPITTVTELKAAAAGAQQRVQKAKAEAAAQQQAAAAEAEKAAKDAKKEQEKAAKEAAKAKPAEDDDDVLPTFRGDAPTPEPVATLNAQLEAFKAGRKPGVLFTDGTETPDVSELPKGAKLAPVKGGMLLYRDAATLKAHKEGRVGEALGYGIDEKPDPQTFVDAGGQVVTARNAEGVPIQDVATDGRPEVVAAAQKVAGPDGTVEVRPVQDALTEREQRKLEEGITNDEEVISGPESRTDEQERGRRHGEPQIQGLPPGQPENAESARQSPDGLTPTAQQQEPSKEGSAVSGIDVAANAAATSPQNNLPEPTPAQKEAGNYQKGHARVAGLDISIENPTGSERSGVSKDGKRWSNTMQSHYGYIRGTVGKDKDHVDVFVKEGTPEDHAGTVFVVDQVDPGTGKFDEHKVMLGYADIDEAKAAYRASYAKGWNGLKTISATPLAGFKEWLKSGDTKKSFLERGEKSESLDIQESPQQGAQVTAPEGYALDLETLRREKNPTVIQINGGEWSVVARRLSPWAAEKGYGDTPEAAQRDALRKVGALTAKPQPIDRIEGPNGMAAEIYPSTSHKGQFNVVLRDTDAQETAGVHIVPTLEAARKRAAELAGLQTPALDPAAPSPPKAARRSDGYKIEPSPRDGYMLVREPRGDGSHQNLAEFRVRKDGTTGGINHFFESPSTRGPVEEAIDRWNAEQAKKPAALTGTQRPSAPDDSVVHSGQSDSEPRSAGARNEQTDTRRADEPAPLGDESDSPLEGVSADSVQGASGERDAGESSAARVRSDAGRDGRADEDRGDLARGVGDNAGAVSVPARGRQDQPRSDGLREADGARLGESAERGRDVTPAGNFVITPEFGLGRGGVTQKYRDNVAAIKLLKQLESKGRQATADEQAVLARYVGWGGLKPVFPRSDGTTSKGWDERAKEVRSLLNDEEYDAARRTVLDAHYTSETIVRGIWEATERFGFKSGVVLEPSLGVGNFFGMMPGSGASRLVGVEYDAITGRIAKQLYPQAHIMAPVGFQEAALPDDSFDLVVGNPPFGSQSISDLSRPHLKGLSIHNFFFAKSLDLLRPDGVMAMVVSRYLMDKQGTKDRAYLAGRTRFLGAIRLPYTAFMQNANTEVTTDIIFLQKLFPGQESAGESWMETATVPDPLGGEPIVVNEYFARHPEMMLGRMERSGEMRQKNDPTLAPIEGRDLAADLREAIANLPAGILSQTSPDSSGWERLSAALRPSDGHLEAMTIDQYAMLADGKIIQRVDDVDGKPTSRDITPAMQWTEKTTLGEARFQRIRELIPVRDALRRQIRLESGTATDAEIEMSRKDLGKRYKAYVQKHGYVNDNATRLAFGEDPDYPLVMALELDYDEGVSKAKAKRLGVAARAPSAKPAAILQRRAIPKRVEATHADTGQDALVISLSERGRVDLEHMARLTSKNEAALIDELHEQPESPRIYLDPETQVWQPANLYLSGNIRNKLAAAKAAGLSRNVAELTKVIPEDVPAAGISVRLGSVWVPPEYYAAFAKHLLGDGTAAGIRYRAIDAKFVAHITAGSAARNRTTWGTERKPATEILEAMLNSQPVQVWDRTVDDRRVLNERETEAARQKADEMASAFQEWIFEDSARRERLVRVYNDTYNSLLPAQFDGAHMTFPGKVPDAFIKMRRHQKNAVWRTIQQPAVLLDHVVGAGKTYTIVAAAMELKRMQLARKPMVAVPNHLVEQWAADFLRLYPGARILATSKKDFEKSRRKRLFARIATGEWDAVIVAHSSFGRFQLKRETEEAFMKEEIDQIQIAIDEERREEGRKTRSVSDLERSKETMRERMKRLLERASDDLLSFEELGVDQLFVDEGHEFKNLNYFTRLQGVLGLGDKQGSKKALDLHMKLKAMRRNGFGRGVVFATGTPISNSLVEMYHLMRYLDPDSLERMGIEHFDAWHKQFATAVSDYELNAAGKLVERTRLNRFDNLPELMAIYRGFADTVTLDDIKAAFLEDTGKQFPIPQPKGGRRVPVPVPPSPQTQAILDSLIERVDRLPTLGKEAKAAERLRIMSDARKLAIDPRVVNSYLPDEPNGKLATAADKIADIYRRWHDKRGAQLVFLDLSVAKVGADKEAKEIMNLRGLMQSPDEDVREAALERLAKYSPDEVDAIIAAAEGRFTAYDDLKKKLAERGIPESEVRFIQEAKTDVQKQEIFDLVKAGQVRVLFGSTSKMGAGTNVQDRLVALHHLDVPYRPSDIEQREGRIIRQGNLFYNEDPSFEVEIYAYVTERTYDSPTWNIQEKKLRMINQVRKFAGAREMEEEDAGVDSAAELKAIASGDPRIFEHATLTKDIRKLENAQRGFERAKLTARDEIKRYETAQSTMPARIEKARPDAGRAEEARKALLERASQRSVNIAGEVFNSAGLALARARDLIDEQKQGDSKAKFALKVDGKEYTAVDPIIKAIEQKLGDTAPYEIEIEGKDYIRRYQAGVRLDEIADAMLKKAIASDDTQERAVGKYLGLDVELFVEAKKNKLFKSGHEVVYGVRLNGAGVYEDSSSSGEITAGSLRRLIENAATQPSGGLAHMERVLERADAELGTLREEVSKPWPKREEFERKKARYRELSNELAGKKDDTKAEQAPPSGQPATEPEPGEGRYSQSEKAPPDAGLSISEARKILEQRLGAETVKALENAGLLRLVETSDDLPLGQESRAPRGVQGFFDGETAWLVTGENSADTIVGAALHELGEHASLAAMMGPERYARLVDQFQRMLAEGDPTARKVEDHVQNLLARGEMRAEDADSERLAYTIEYVTNSPNPQSIAGKVRLFVQSLLAQVRAWLRTHPTLGRHFQNMQLTPRDLAALARRAVRWRAARATTAGGLAVNSANAQFSRTDATEAAYERRIDELFAGATARTGTRLLDSSDVMAILGYPEVPMVLSESHLRKNMRQDAHPEMTAEVWKKVPGWIENPAVAYRSRDELNPGRITLIGPELVDGRAVIIGIEPDPNPASSKAKPVPATASLLVTAFAHNSIPPYQAIIDEDKLLYYHTQKAPEMWQRGGVQFPKQADISSGRRKILTEKNLAGYRRTRQYSVRADDVQTRDTAQDLPAAGGIFTPDAEAAFQEARKGVGRRPLTGKLKERWEFIKNGFQRPYIHLPNSAKFARAYETFRRFENAHNVAQIRAERLMADTVGALTPAEYVLFERAIILRDLRNDVDKGLPLPRGFTPSNVMHNLTRVDADMTDPVREALRVRKRYQEEIRDKLIEHNILDPERADNDSYFHHQVLAYARLRDRMAKQGAIRPPRPGFAKARHGTEELFNMNFLEAEFEYLTGALVSIEKAKTLAEIRSDYDIKRDLVRQAKEHNQQLLDTLVTADPALAMQLAIIQGAGNHAAMRAAIKNALGTRAKDWKDFLPVEYETWQPEKGNYFYRGLSIEENIIEAAIDAAGSMLGDQREAVAAELSRVRQALMVGGPKEIMAIPAEVRMTLEGMKTDEGHWLGKLFDFVVGGVTRRWKQWVLINPYRWAKYNLNNMTGDIDAIIAGAPGTLKYLPDAFKEAVAFLRGNASELYMEALDAGVIDNSLEVVELPDVTTLASFEKLTGKERALPVKAIRGVWDLLRGSTRFRENVFRLAAYMHYRRRIEAGESLKEIGYGAVVPEMADALYEKDPKLAAGLMARDLLIDYRAISAFGKDLRQYVFPFWSWIEGNLRRYIRLLNNAFVSGRREGLVASSVVTAGLLSRMAIVYGIVQALAMVLGDDDDEPDPLARSQLHVPLGKTDDGKIMSLRLQGAFSDILSWAGLEDVVPMMEEIEKGRASWSDLIKGMAKAPANKLIGAVSPVYKVPLELVSGRTYWPDAFDSKLINDKARHVARVFSLENEYDLAAGRPSDGYLDGFTGAVVYQIDEGQNAYNRVRSMAFRYKEHVSGERGGDFIPNMDMYYYKQAVKLGDKEAAAKYRERVKRTMKNPKASIASAHPLGMLNKDERRQFERSLDKRERHLYDRANDWYEDTYEPRSNWK